jgi:DNA-binding NarL/FixJ family response regulator
LIETFQKPIPKPEQGVLSAREMEVLELVARGLANKEIASHLNISFDGVRNHLRRIYEKLHVHGRTEAVMKCFNISNLKPSPPL